MYSVAIRTSTAGTRPMPSDLRTRRWEMTARKVVAICKRICFCSGGGKTAMMRWTVSVASSVCRVEELDGVLDGDDVVGAPGVDAVDHGGERRGLAAAGGSGHEHHAADFLAD